MLLNVLTFKSTISSQPTLDALNVLQELNNKGKRKLLADVSTDFVSKKWEGLVRPEADKIDRSFLN